MSNKHALTVLLDANVLVPISVCNVFLTFAEFGILQPIWSWQILSEVKRAFVRAHPSLPEERIERRIHAMTTTFPEALIDVTEDSVAGVTLPDQNDRHVAAAAIVGGARLIVTNNLRDFPEVSISGFGLAAVAPDDFLTKLTSDHPEDALDAMRILISRLHNPPLSVQNVLDRLERAGVANFATTLRTLGLDA